jgi:putative peptide zinc metalloprotease protein
MKFALIPLLLLVTACTDTGANPPPSAQPAASPKPATAASPAPAAAKPSLSPSPVAAGDRVDPSTIQLNDVGGWHDFDRGGGSNVVRVDNTKDGAFRARGNAELDRIRRDEVTSANIAEAHASCTDCQTIAAAVQVVVYQRGASTIAPVNRAVAVNESCTRCVTVARAIQWVIPVDDVREVPREVAELVRRVDREANYFERIKDLDDVDPKAAQARLNQLEADFGMLQQFLSDMQDRKDDGPATPSPSPSASLSPVPAVSPAASPVPRKP